MDVYTCNKCNKLYASYKSLWNHTSKFHILNSIKSNSKVTQESHKSNSKVTPNNKCKYCDKTYKYKQGRYKHEQTCDNNIKMNIIDNKLTDNLIKENEIIKKQLSELSNKYNELLKLCKIHPKTLQKINKQLINNTNNGTINNGTINIVKFGSEDIASILSKSEILKILNRKMLALEESIKTIHFNEARPELKNIYITNLKDQYAYIYNGTKFIAVLKSDILGELVDNHIENIEYSIEEYKDKLQPKTVEVLDKFIEKMNNDDDEFIDKEHHKIYPNYKSFTPSHI
jgi:hypothetical protein